MSYLKFNITDELEKVSQGRKTEADAVIVLQLNADELIAAKKQIDKRMKHNERLKRKLLQYA